MFKIAQIGSFDVENFGDLLFPNILENQLGKEFKIDLFSPVGGRKCFDIKKKVYSLSKFKKLCIKKKYDLVVIGGGDVIRTDSRIFITNEFYELSSEPSLKLWAYPIIIAKELNIPVVLNAVGVTNNFSEAEIPVIRNILNMCDYIGIRDSEAYKTLEQIGVSNLKLVPDSVLLISRIFEKSTFLKTYNKLKRLRVVPKIDNYIIFQHNSKFIDDDDYYNKLISCIKEISKEKKILLMPIGYIHNDHKVLEKIYEEKIPNVYKVNFKYKLKPFEQISIICNSDGYIGTSMHGAVVSNSYGVPVLILNTLNSKKLHGFANISNNANVDANLLDNLVYIFKNNFGNVDIEKITELQNQIEKHFEIIKNFSEFKKKNNENSYFVKFIKEYYEYQNNMENNIFGYYYNSKEGILNRHIFKWDYVDNKLKLSLENDSSEEYIIYPFVNQRIYVSNIKVNEKYKLNNVIEYGNLLIFEKYSSIEFKNVKNINIELELKGEDDLINLLKKN